MPPAATTTMTATTTRSTIPLTEDGQEEQEQQQGHVHIPFQQQSSPPSHTHAPIKASSSSSSSSSTTLPTPPSPSPSPPLAPPPAPPRNMYEKKEIMEFWDAPLIVAIAANFLWPAVLLLLTIWSQLVVLYFRLSRFIEESVLRKTMECVDEGDNAPMALGLYFFSYDNQCEKWHPPSSSTTAAASGTPTTTPTSTTPLKTKRRGFPPLSPSKKQDEASSPPPPPPSPPTHGHGHCRYFDPNKPTVIYVHGFSRGTTARRFREMFTWKDNDKQYGLDINAADRWLDAGWNIGVFYWTNHADEEMPQDTESKIWTSNGRTGMRYRTICPKKGHVTFYTSSRPSSSISHMLADLLVEVFRGAKAPYRLVGHSLGTQLVVHATTLLSQRKAREEEEREASLAAAAAAAAAAVEVVEVEAAAAVAVAAKVMEEEEEEEGDKEKQQEHKHGKNNNNNNNGNNNKLNNNNNNKTNKTSASSSSTSPLPQTQTHTQPQPPITLPTRIALLDVFGTLGVKAYLSGWPIMLVVQKEISALREDHAIVFEQYQSSLIGRRGLWFRHLTAFVQLDPPHIPWYRLRSRHIAAPYLYFLSFGQAVDGPKLKKADLRRKESTEIYFGRKPSLGGSVGGGVEIGSEFLLEMIVEGEQQQRKEEEEGVQRGKKGKEGKEYEGKGPSSPLSSMMLLRRRIGGGRQQQQQQQHREREKNVSLTSSMSTSLCSSLGGSLSLSGSGGGSSSSSRTAMTTTTSTRTAAAGERGGRTEVPLPSSSSSSSSYESQHHNKNHLRFLTASLRKKSPYREVEVDAFPPMARASDEEVRELMHSDYVYKQIQGHLFLRVSRAW